MDSKRAGLGAGGRRQGLAGLRDDAPSERSATKRRRCGGSRRACGACLGAGGRRQGQGGLSGRAKLRPVGGCRGACKAGLGSGGRRQGLAGLRDDAPSERSATKRRRCGGSRRACGACLGAGGRRQGLGWIRDDAPSERSATKRRRCGGRRGACGAWPRCRRAAAGPGRASRSITPSRRLACGDLAGGPPPTGTHSGQTQQDGPRGGRARRRPENPWCHKPRPKVRTPRSTPGSGRPDDRRGDRGR